MSAAGTIHGRLAVNGLLWQVGGQRPFSVRPSTAESFNGGLWIVADARGENGVSGEDRIRVVFADFGEASGLAGKLNAVQAREAA